MASQHREFVEYRVFKPWSPLFGLLARGLGKPEEPLAKLTVTPEDFPFLTQIRGHDDERLQDYANALQTGAPWPNGAGWSSFKPAASR